MLPTLLVVRLVQSCQPLPCMYADTIAAVLYLRCIICNLVQDTPPW